MFNLEKVGNIIGWGLTLAYGAYIVVTTVKEAKELTRDNKFFNELKKNYTRSAEGWKPEGEVIETTFVD